MTFEEILDQAIAMLQRRGRLTYGALKRQFQLDDAYLDDVKAELIEGQRVAADEDGRVLVWTGAAGSASPAPSLSAPTQEHAPLTYTPSYLAEKILTSRSALEGERKQVTVLFADLKGSMELLADRDPEDARAILDPVLEKMMDAVHRYEGTVNQIMGDGIMALFGAPIAHEDHAVRACYAALAMQEAISRYSEAARRAHGITVQIRVGLNSGEVVVRAIGNDLHMDYSAIGQTVHLAARMEQLATPGTTLLSNHTFRLAKGYLEARPLGPTPVKGLQIPVEIYELVRAEPTRSRLQVAAASGLTTFVGRSEEVGQLRTALERAHTGHGQVVAVIGEPGVGKSRLFWEFLRSPHPRGWLCLEASPLSYGRTTPYLPIIDLLRGYFQIEPHQEPEHSRDKVTTRLLNLDPLLEPVLPALLFLLNLRVDAPQWQAIDPAQRRHQILEAVKRLLLRHSQTQPLLLVVENLHWIDTETQAVLDRLVDSLATARILLLVNYRPEYQHAWGPRSSYRQLRLDPLAPDSARVLLGALLGANSGLDPFKQLLVERTGGNPFFLEESVRALVETGALVGQRGTYRLASASGGPSIQVPATVQAVLTARIDRLPSEDKRLLQGAAVIGKDVPLPLLREISELPDEALRTGLARLHAAEFLYEASLFPELEYTFKHALTQEVAYGSLLHERRRALHSRIVTAIEGTLLEQGMPTPARLTEQLERLAHHAFHGEMWAKAVEYFRQAGVKAFDRSVLRESAGCFEQALVALAHLPRNPTAMAQAIDLHLLARNALYPLGEQERLFDHLRRAEALATTIEDQRRLAQVLSNLTQYFWAAGDPPRGIEAGQRAQGIAKALNDGELGITTNFYLGLNYLSQGDYRQARALFTPYLEVLEGERIREHFGMAGFPALFYRGFLAQVLAELGMFTEAIATAERAVQIGEILEQPYSLNDALNTLGSVHLLRGDIRLAIRVLERALALSRSRDLHALRPEAASPLGYALALSGHLGEALPLLEQAVQQAASTNRLYLQPRRVAWLSEAYLLDGRVDEAMTTAHEALGLSRKHKARGYEAWALRISGEIACRREPPAIASAEAHYRQALVLAEELGMRPLQAHCHRGLGTLYATSDQREQARAELSTAVKMYRAMAMTFWLPQVEAAQAQVEDC
jgi:class 3 adenylate cyclase/tetratricopeptide (TPR) repeat protein